MIQFNIKPSTEGTVRTYNQGATATLIATPNAGYHFTRWSDGVKQNPRVVPATEGATYVAIFALNLYEVEVKGGAHCTTVNSGCYSHGQRVQISASPHEGYHFVQWQDGNTDNPRTITVTGDAIYTATFARDGLTVNGVSFAMVKVEGGTFTMGPDAGSDEAPAHRVTLGDYYIGETEVTQALWEAVMGSNPSTFKGADLPVENVSWEDVQEFITKLNQLTGQQFCLPSEAEWEYAARGGNKSRGYRYSGSDDIDAVAWWRGNSGNQTHAVRTKAPNELGLYDMTGNVWEWCHDWWSRTAYTAGAQTNPMGPANGWYRVYRGGCWFSDTWEARVRRRNYYYAEKIYFNLGFRLALRGAHFEAGR